ncbi:hypothetical protein ACIHFE_01980 [Streptomyces sp. NPDC052396]|uniref:hypothetical protein n=1 Tax=Streptomyces sp. NPDC052396 TaxID=3365689 RepID=UPI0037D306F0
MGRPTGRRGLAVRVRARARGRAAAHGRRARAHPPPGARTVAWDRGWRREARSAWCFGLGLTGVLLGADAARSTLDWPRGCCWLVLGGTLLLVLRPARVSAGEDWLAVRGLLRERRVRTDRLTRLRRLDGVSARLVLRDAAGVRIEVDPEVLCANPLLWHRLETGARRSREQGSLHEGAGVLTALAERIDVDGARRIFEVSGLE